MLVSPDRIHSSYNTITSLSSYAMPAYLLTFNEPNYIYSYGTSDDDRNVLDPATAARLWPQLMGYFDPLGIKLIAPSAINCEGDPNCQNVPTAAGWLSAFQTVSRVQICSAESASLFSASSAVCLLPMSIPVMCSYVETPSCLCSRCYTVQLLLHVRVSITCCCVMLYSSNSSRCAKSDFNSSICSPKPAHLLQNE